MAIVLPFIFFFLSVCALHQTRAADWREIILLAAVIWGVLVTSITEALSILNMIQFSAIFTTWAVAIAIAGAIVFRTRSLAGKSEKSHLTTSPFLSPVDKALILSLLAISLFTALLAWLAPPNTWDSMTYHMSRVVHWIQNGNINFYQTAILRQLHSNPWAEYVILNFQILSGTDRFANFIQWFAMIGCLIGTTLVAKELGANRRGQLYAAVICATIPMGILQSTSTQTDYVVAFWILCFVYFCFRFVATGSTPLAYAIGASLGLGVLTKGTSYVFAFPFVLALILASIKQFGWKKLIVLGSALLIALLVNIGHYSRNFDLYGKPLGPGSEGGEYTYSNQTNGFAPTASNILRNTGLHLAVYTPIDLLVEKALVAIHKKLGISINDPRTTWPGTEFHVQGLSHNEDDAGNGLHVILVAATLFCYIFGRKKQLKTTAYATLISASFIIFCASLKWQPWHSRLHLPLFVLWAPFCGLLLARVRGPLIAPVVMASLIFAAVFSLVFSATKPVFAKENVFNTSRTSQYFKKRPTLEKPYREAVKVIAAIDCANVGVINSGDDWEYPFSVLLKDQGVRNARLEYINTASPSEKKNQGGALNNGFNPCAIVNINSVHPNQISAGQNTYTQKWSAEGLAVYFRSS